jgi:hypothetical protein
VYPLQGMCPVCGSAAGLRPAVIEPWDWHMDSGKAEQHDDHVQRDDGHEQDDENLQSGRDLTESSSSKLCN